MDGEDRCVLSKRKRRFSGTMYCVFTNVIEVSKVRRNALSFFRGVCAGAGVVSVGLLMSVGVGVGRGWGYTVIVGD